mmetsp:Transcript_2738/g.8434  ORF Transcript_2738/g.8434 Transcript_2738/m.8434 type:complete len:249 (-) Transcript_2738:380-1126(-)
MVRSGRFLAPSSALTMDSRISYVRSHPSNELISPVLLHALMCTRPCVATGLRVLLLTSMPGLFASPVPPSDPSSIPWKILMDQTVYAASKYSMYLGLVNLLRGRDCTDCVQEIREKLWPTLTTGWRFWPAVHIITYNLIPPRHRVLWVNCADLIWVTLLASIARGSEQDGGLGQTSAAPSRSRTRMGSTGNRPISSSKMGSVVTKRLEGQRPAVKGRSKVRRRSARSSPRVAARRRLTSSKSQSGSQW